MELKETLRTTTRPLELNADKYSRLQIPSLVREMIGVGPGTRFSLHVTDNDGLYFAKLEK